MAVNQYPQTASTSSTFQNPDTPLLNPRSSQIHNFPNYGENPPQYFSFNDVLASIRKFSGDDHVDIVKWIQQFEDTAVVMNWSDIQKLVFAKRFLSGNCAG